jgi:hypothetical protein
METLWNIFYRTPHFSIRRYVLAFTVSGHDGHCHTKGSFIPETSSNARGIEEKSSVRNCGHFTARYKSAMSSLLSRLNKCIAFEEVTRETLLQHVRYWRTYTEFSKLCDWLI